MGPAWSRWLTLDAPSRIAGAAVYRLRLTDGVRTVGIPRFLAQDSAGILMIGESGSFENRRKQLRKALECGDGHSEGNLLWWLVESRLLERACRAATYQYSVRATSSKERARATESDLILDYVTRYGEVPPLNSAMPGRARWIAEARKRALARATAVA